MDDFPFILRQKVLNGKANAVDGAKRVRIRERGRAIPAPEANAEIQTNLDVSQTCSYICLLSTYFVLWLILISYSFNPISRQHMSYTNFHE